jgi:ribonuclease VapC
MIVVDASALLAIFLKEDDAEGFARRLTGAGEAVISSVNYWEVLAKAHVLHGSRGPGLIDELLATLNISVAATDEMLAREAAAVFDRYRGRPARLNLGDSFAYALAQQEGDGLLFKGNDFPRTDVKSAL